MNRAGLIVLLSEFVPIAAFYFANRLVDFNTAVAVLVGTTFISCVLGWLTVRHVPAIALISSVFITVGGALTLITDNPDPVIFSDTVYFSFLGLSLLFTLARGRLILKQLFHHIFAVTDAGWREITWGWIIVFLLLAVSNEIARATITPDAWVTYRVWVFVGITIFGCYQFTVSRRHRIPEAANQWGLRHG